MDILKVSIFILLFIIGLSILIHYFTSIYTYTELPDTHWIMFIIATIFLTLSIFSIPIELNINLNYYTLPLLLIGHLICYNYCYIILIILFSILYIIDIKILKSKFIIKIFNLLNINFNYIFHPRLNIINCPLNKNFKLLKFLLFLSYFLSIISFKFFFEPYLITSYEVNDIIKDSITTYTDIFIISIIPVFISYFKNIKR